MHTHYKNLRIVQSLEDWIEMAEGFKFALDRWKKRGEPQPDIKRHIELCRKKVMSCDSTNTIQINLNRNLYNYNKDKVFAEGADFDQPLYIHLKIRDLRVELSLEDFKELASATQEAEKKIQDCDPGAVLQEERVHEQVLDCT